jgi:hypothetical protein
LLVVAGEACHELELEYEGKKKSRKDECDARVTLELLGIGISSILIPKPMLISSALAILNKLPVGDKVFILLSCFFHLLHILGGMWSSSSSGGSILVGVDPRKLKPNYWRRGAYEAMQ